MATATWIRSLLDQEGVSYEERHHAEAFTAQEVAQQEHVSGHRLAKVVLALADGKPIALALPASRRVLLERVRALLGAREIRLATEAEMARLCTGCEVGALPALRLWRGVDVLMDAALHTEGDILMQGGTHTDALRMRFADWFRMVRPRVESFSEPIVTPPGMGSAN